MRRRRQSRYWKPVAVGKEIGLALRCLHTGDKVTLNSFICED